MVWGVSYLGHQGFGIQVPAVRTPAERYSKSNRNIVHYG